ncbi:hypothetical protein ABZY93_09250 [Streptomyces smyrnaeus]|uniref:hypothetical protein n=1 Tax=Streptomyces smyrnaeus TaxID=1387713 RepID=UPI0033A3F944
MTRLVEYPRDWILHAGALVLEMNESVTAQEADMLDGLGLNGLKDFKEGKQSVRHRRRPVRARHAKRQS